MDENKTPATEEIIAPEAEAITAPEAEAIAAPAVDEAAAPAADEKKTLLKVKDLKVSFFTPAGEVKAVSGISYSLG